MDKQNSEPLNKRECLKLFKKSFRLMKKGFDETIKLPEADRDWIGKKLGPFIKDADEYINELLEKQKTPFLK
jgi:hypothetical protein